MSSSRELFQKRGLELIAGRKGELCPQGLREVLHRDLDQVREALKADLRSTSSSIEFLLPSGWIIGVYSDESPNLSLKLISPQGINQEFENKVKRIGPVLNVKGEPIKAFVHLKEPAGLLLIDHESPPLYARMDDERIRNSRPMLSQAMSRN